MNSQITLGLTLVAGIGIGAAVVEGLNAQAKPPAFIVVENTVTNQDSYVREFVPVIGKAVQAHGGKFLAAGGKTVSIFGDPPKSLVVLTQFPNLDQAQAFAAAQDTKDAVAIGNKYATLRWFAVEGVSP